MISSDQLRSTRPLSFSSIGFLIDLVIITVIFMRREASHALSSTPLPFTGLGLILALSFQRLHAGKRKGLTAAETAHHPGRSPQRDNPHPRMLLLL